MSDDGRPESVSQPVSDVSAEVVTLDARTQSLGSSGEGPVHYNLEVNEGDSSGGVHILPPSFSER